MSLTPMQELFAQNVASGKSQSASYRLAYPKSVKWGDSSVWVNAAKLMAIAHVSLRVDALKAELAEKALWKREDSVRELMAVINAPDKAVDIVAAVKVLNEMHGYNEPKEVKHSGGMDIRWADAKS